MPSDFVSAYYQSTGIVRRPVTAPFRPPRRRRRHQQRHHHNIRVRHLAPPPPPASGFRSPISDPSVDSDSEDIPPPQTPLHRAFRANLARRAHDRRRASRDQQRARRRLPLAEQRELNEYVSSIIYALRTDYRPPDGQSLIYRAPPPSPRHRDDDDEDGDDQENVADVNVVPVSSSV